MTTTRATAPSSRARTSRAARASSSDYLPELGFGAWVPVATRDHPLHRLRGAVRAHRGAGRRSARHHARSPDRHRRHDRADGRPLLSREMPRPAVRGVRARRAWRCPSQRTAAARSSTPRASICCARRRSSSPKCAPSASMATSTRAYRYLEILYGGSNPYMEAIERNVEYLRADPAQRELAAAAAPAADLRRHRRPDGDDARADARLHQASLVRARSK